MTYTFVHHHSAWGHGLWHGTIAPLALGIQIVAYSGKFQAKMVLEALQELKVNNFAAAATVYRMLRRESLESNYHLSVSSALLLVNLWMQNI